MENKPPENQGGHEQAFVFLVESFNSLVMGMNDCEDHTLSITNPALEEKKHPQHKVGNFSLARAAGFVTPLERLLRGSAETSTGRSVDVRRRLLTCLTSALRIQRLDKTKNPIRR
jgi:hypothetical protein